MENLLPRDGKALHDRRNLVSRRVALTTALILVAGIAVGCAGDDASDPDAGLLPSDVDPLGAAQFAEVLESHRGHVVLVNLWATWCAPCLREIPELVELESKLGPEGFRLIGISLDDPGSEAEIREFRDQRFPGFRTFYTEDEDWSALVGQIEPEWISVLPTSFVLDRSGALVATLTGGQDYAAFEAAVTPYL